MATDTETALAPEVRTRVQRCVALAAALHERWRGTRLQEDGTYIPRVEVDDQGVACDLANTRFEDLPAQWRVENLVAAMSALAAAEVAIRHGSLRGQALVDVVAGHAHEQWLERNGAFAPAAQCVPFEELAPQDKLKDRIVARMALDAFAAR